MAFVSSQFTLTVCSYVRIVRLSDHGPLAECVCVTLVDVCMCAPRKPNAVTRDVLDDG
jgi:hypothetical protein